MGRILVFGASIVNGGCDYENSGWVELLKKEYRRMRPVVNSLYNLGVSGNSSQDIIDRMENECKARLNTKYRNENVIIMSFGHNDLKSMRGHGDDYIPDVTIEEFKDNIREAINIACRYVSTIIFVGLSPINEGKNPLIRSGREIWFSDTILRDYNQAAMDICREEEVIFIDIYKDFLSAGKDLLHDTVHPNAEGHKIIYGIIRKKLIEMKLM